jgi:hypothetical protein
LADWVIGEELEHPGFLQELAIHGLSKAVNWSELVEWVYLIRGGLSLSAQMLQQLLLVDM